jgi:hypothetical protein
MDVAVRADRVLPLARMGTNPFAGKTASVGKKGMDEVVRIMDMDGRKKWTSGRYFLP